MTVFVEQIVSANTSWSCRRYPPANNSHSLLLSRCTSLKISLSVCFSSKISNYLFLKLSKRWEKKVRDWIPSFTIKQEIIINYIHLKKNKVFHMMIRTPSLFRRACIAYMWKYFCKVRPWNYYHFVIYSILVST